MSLPDGELAPSDRLVGINFIPLSTILSAELCHEHTAIDDLAKDLTGLLHNLETRTVLNVVRGPATMRAVASPKPQRGTMRVSTPRRRTINRAMNWMQDDQDHGGRLTAETQPMTPCWMSNLPGPSYRRFTTGSLLHSPHETDNLSDLRDPPMKPRRISCMFGKNERIWDWLQLSFEPGNGLVVSAVTEAARRRGLAVGDSLVECRSTRDEAKNRVESLWHYANAQEFWQSMRMEPPLVLILWRTTAIDALKVSWIGPTPMKHMSYKPVNIIASRTLTTPGLKISQPSRDDVSRFQVVLGYCAPNPEPVFSFILSLILWMSQICSINPAVAVYGFAVGDELVGVDFTPLTTEPRSIPALQKQLVTSKVCNCLCWWYIKCQYPLHLNSVHHGMTCRL